MEDLIIIVSLNNEREREKGERREEEEALDVVDLVFVPFHFVG